jgi:hypothetical protein
VSNDKLDISPWSGWTYQDWQNVGQKILTNIFPHFSPGRALVEITSCRPSIYGSLSDMVEGFARTFLLVGFWLNRRQDGIIISEDGSEINWVEICREGLLNGTNPKHPEYWGKITGKHQYMVEAGSLVIGLYFSRHLIWDSFRDHEKEQIGRWFQHILKFPFEDKNWVLFGLIINAFLKQAGLNYHQDQIEFYLSRYDSYYEAEGWYRDGVANQYDYYNPWALHFYPHIWSQMETDPEKQYLKNIFEERSRRFLEKFSYFFSSNAVYPAFGRSLIYRCAATAGAIIGVWKDFSPISAGLTRRLASQSLKYFAVNNFFDLDGSIPLGWLGKFEPMAEMYSGPASPMWLNKIFSSLLMPEDHAFWLEKEEPLPVEENNYCITHKAPGFLVQGHKDSGHVQLINQGSDSYVNSPTDWKNPASDYHYHKFSYSSHLFHDVGPSNDGLNCGNMISLFEDKRGFSERMRIYPTHISDRVAISYHYPFGEIYDEKRDSRIETAIVMKDDHQIRIHRVISPNKPFIFEGGYSLAYNESLPQITKGENWIAVRTEKATSCIRGLFGYDENGTSPSEGKNPLGKYSILPFVKTSKPVFAQQIVACEIIARPADFDIEAELSLITGFQVENRIAEINFSDGEKVKVKLGHPENHEQIVTWSIMNFTLKKDSTSKFEEI